MIDQMPLVSAIITTHKREPEIVARAIASIINQTYENIEIIVVDDSPASYEKRTDVEKMLKAYDEPIIYIKHEKNMGACVARNTGMEAANGEFLAYLDDDDEWFPEKIETQMKRFIDDQISLVYCGYIVRNLDTHEKREYKSPYAEGDIYDTLLTKGNFVGSTSFPVIRKEHLQEVGGFDPLMESSQDFDVWLRLAKKYSIACVKKPLVFYNVYNGERISTNRKKKINGILRLIEKNKEAISTNKYAKKRMSRKLAAHYAKEGKFVEMTKWGWRALKARF